MTLVHIEFVDAERIVDLRWRVLRPTRPREAVQFAVHTDSDAFHLAALVADRPVGCVTFFPEPYDGEPAWRLRGMAVDESFRNRGIGGELIVRGIAEVADRGGALVWCNGRSSAARFYERHGFERHGEEFIVVPSGPHYVFIRRLRWHDRGMDALDGGVSGQERADAAAAPYVVDWAAAADRLGGAAQDQAGWYAGLARDLVGGALHSVVAVDVGCGGGGMTAALASVLDQSGLVVAVDATPEVLAVAETNVAAAVPPGGARVAFVQADLAESFDRLVAALDRPADLIWASASVHHLGDQQAAVGALAGLLAPGGRLALAEGGLRARHLPWDLGVGEPGLELRLDAAQDLWFARMRAELPGSVPMPYGWTEALRRAGLSAVSTRSTLIEQSAPLAGPDRDRVLDSLAHQVDRVRPTDLLNTEDVAVWDRLLDPADPNWLGHREDLYVLEARSVHLGVSR